MIVLTIRKYPILYSFGSFCIALISTISLCADNVAIHGEPVPAKVEMMYRKGLRYLLQNQNSQGAFMERESSRRSSEVAITGLAIVAMLAYGDDPNSSIYGQAIKRGLNYLLTRQRSNGYVGNSMYNHGFATLALAEAYGAVDDPRIGPALQKALNLLLTSQAKNRKGAWRYSPTSTDADTTVAGACLVALFAARNAGLLVPKKAIEKGLKFYQLCQGKDGRIGYTSRQGGSPVLSAIAILQFALAKQKKSSMYKGALGYLANIKNKSHTGHPYYYLYYVSQAFFHAGGEYWREFNKHNTNILSQYQDPDGSWTGGNNGAVFSTSAALLSLALNYRFLPIYER